MALRSTNKLFRGKCTSNSLYQPLLSDKGKEMFQLQWLYYWLGVLLNSELYCSFAQFKDLEVQEGNIINKGTETSTCHSLQCRQAGIAQSAAWNCKRGDKLQCCSAQFLCIDVEKPSLYSAHKSDFWHKSTPTQQELSYVNFKASQESLTSCCHMAACDVGAKKVPTQTSANSQVKVCLKKSDIHI